MIQKAIRLIFGSKNERDIKKIIPLIEQINAWAADISKFSDSELKAQSTKFKAKLKSEQGPTSVLIEDILPEAFATVREAAWRSLGMRHFDVQMMGAVALHQGRIAEMKTGEGKTLTATAAVYLNALVGKGVHVVTVNDYLAKRDAEWMRPVYDMMGLSVGFVQHDMDPIARQEAYKADISYGTNSEFGFDYLRDNMLTEKEQRVQRGFYFAIVDEVDSILIDEARTPLIISGPTEEDTGMYANIERAVRHLIDAEEKAPEPEPLNVQPGKEEPHVLRHYYYDVDEKARNVFLTETGIHKLEEILGIDNLFALDNTELVAHSSQALRAHLIFKEEVDYVVQSGEVVLVDEHTGRTMPGRRYGDGLHQAIEAKERVEIKQESQTLASVTYQNFFRMYLKLSGMTGTADTEAEEFKKIYKLDVIVIPTNAPVRRIDYPDRIYCTEEEKYAAIIEEIKDCVERGQPSLVGTISIEKSEELSELLKKGAISHNILNARHHVREAEIIANAGKLGAVTVATNMAGRGTDIVLGGTPQYLSSLEQLSDEEELDQDFKKLMLKRQFDQAKEFLEQAQASASKKQNLKDIYDRSQIWLSEHKKVKEVGGLHILGTERHEARRIDNQLRGRSGRQGDPGSSRFYLSLEDHLMRIFGGERIKNIMNTLGMQHGQELEASMVDRAIARAQKRVESHNFDIRKHLLEYDEVMNKQREFVYNERNILVENQNVRKRLLSWVDEVIESRILDLCATNDSFHWDIEALGEWLKNVLLLELSIDPKEFRGDKNPQLKLFHLVQSAAHKRYEEKIAQIGEEAFNYVECRIALDVIDARWKEHLHQMDQLREGVWASGYAERNPLVEFKLRGFEFFDKMVETIKEQVCDYLFRVQIEGPLEMEKPETASSSSLRASNAHHESYNSFDTLSQESVPRQNSLPLPLSMRKNSENASLPDAASPARKSASGGGGGGASRRRSSRRRKKN